MKIFLRKHAGDTIDLFDEIVEREAQGSIMAAQILDALDADYTAKGKPDPDALVRIAVQAGWFESGLRDHNADVVFNG